MSDTHTENNGKIFDEEEYQKCVIASSQNYYSDSDSSDDECYHPAEPNHECPDPEPYYKPDYNEFYSNQTSNQTLIGCTKADSDLTKADSDLTKADSNQTKTKEDLDLTKAASRLCLTCKLNYRCHNQLLECLSKDSALAHKGDFLHNLQVSIDNIQHCGCFLAYDY